VGAIPPTRTSAALGDRRFSKHRVFIVCSSIYTGGVARLVTEKRNAFLRKLAFDSARGAKLFFSQCFFGFLCCAFGHQKAQRGGDCFTGNHGRRRGRGEPQRIGGGDFGRWDECGQADVFGTGGMEGK
jgi:hypothetical protein